ncbi:GLPGLI family protein [Flavobacterium sp. XS1P32]|uniref:GLPGLI family protein n=1 Tax=unclassified Flavobacterium TaxID=196869 RepID=UPI003AAF4305
MKYIIVCFLLFTISIYSQSGIITYDVRVEKQSEEVPKEFSEILKKSLDHANSQKFELTFNKNISRFVSIQKAGLDNDYDKQAEILARLAFSTGSDFFYDKNLETEIEQKGDGTLIKTIKSFTKWDITSESKSISNYLCYKAILEITFVNRKGISGINTIIAWFAPSLPFTFGPKNFYGLPGLILELHENKTTYLVTKVVLSSKEIKIDFPKGKTISKEEYDKKLEASMGGVIIGKKREKEKNSQ